MCVFISFASISYYSAPSNKEENGAVSKVWSENSLKDRLGFADSKK